MDNSFKSIFSSYGSLVKKRGNGFNIAVSLLIFLLLMMYILVHDSQDEQQTGPQAPNTSQTRKKESQWPTGSLPKIDKNFPDWEKCQVDRCVDGDTIIVFSRNLKERVRLLGIDTPETVKKNVPVQPFGPEASEYTKKRIAQANNYVYLKVDGDRTDRYDRRLALVYLDEQQTLLLNKELVENGLARMEPQYNYSAKMKDLFRIAEKKAQAERLGIWSLPENVKERDSAARAKKRQR